MIIWDEVVYSIEKAKKDFEDLPKRDMSSIEVNEEYKELRNCLIEARDLVYDEHKFDLVDKLGYNFDLTFGLEIYEILTKRFKFKRRHASKDDIWRFLQLEIIPDIVNSRWKIDNEDRFYKNSRRIWLKTIWWYIHLSWTGDKDSTYKLLKNNTTDTIMQLVERPGLGYNVEMFREIMKRYGGLNDTSQYSRDLFRKILIMNTARSIIVSPEIIQGGVSSYVDGLFESIMDWG